MRRLGIVIAFLAAAGVVTPVGSAQATPPALSYTPVAGWWGTNGRVTDIVPVGSKVFLAGGFDYIGPETGYGTPVDSSAGVSLPSSPIVDGVVSASAPDGNGGWYIAGTFNHVGGVARKNAAHLTAAGALDTKWNPKPNNAVYALAVSGSEVVFGGAFTAIGKTQVAASRIGAGDLTQGYVIPGFTASADNSVRAIAASGSSVFVGGDFANVGASAHKRLARIDRSTGAV